MSKLHEQIMEELQQEWESEPHVKQRYRNDEGIRSSQISALVGYLIKKGIITKEHLDES